MSKYHVLIDKFIEHSIAPDERAVLEKWVQENETNMAFFRNRLKESGKTLPANFDTDLAYQRFFDTIKSQKKAPKPAFTLFKYAAMVAVLFAIGFLVKQQLYGDASETTITVVENEPTQPIGNEVVIKLADGTTKVLNAEDESVITDANGNVVANKSENTLVFDETEELSKKSLSYNEVFIPFGEIFKLKLSDGTVVWLNAGSKLRFPQTFVNSDKNRIVYLEGEAFFDVVENKHKPFIVNTQEIDIRVLGTKFNVSSYETDAHIATTLVEGSVQVYETRTPENNMRLTPHFQATYNKFGNNFGKEKVNTDLYTAWMQNRLVIDNLRFSEVLVKLERKYFVKFVNEAEHLNDEIYKGEFVDEDIESILKTISLSTPFNYEINQNTITIMK